MVVVYVLLLRLVAARVAVPAVTLRMAGWRHARVAVTVDAAARLLLLYRRQSVNVKRVGPG